MKHEWRDETGPLKGSLLIQIRSADDDRVINEERVDNLVVTSGYQLLASILAGKADRPSQIALGTSGTAAAAGQTSLVAEVYRKGISSANVNGRQVSFYTFISSGQGNGFTFLEAGLFSSSTMFARTVFSSIAKTSSISVTITWTITIGG